MLFFWTVYSSENPERNVLQILQKILSSKTFFNIENNHIKLDITKKNKKK